MSRIESAFADGPTFIPYLVAGDPSIDATARYVTSLADAGAGIIELGLPFSEPIAEGPTIQRAIGRALRAGMTTDRYFDLVESLDVRVPIVCMTYYNLVYRFGDETGPRPFVERAAAVGVDGLIVPDLPVEESGPLDAACTELGIDLIFIVAPTTTEPRLERIRDKASGFVYVQSRLGTTGARDDISRRTKAALDRVEDWDVPQAVGFGIATPSHASTVVSAGADGVIVGSALVETVAEGTHTDGSVASTASRLKRHGRAFVDAIDRTDPLAPEVRSILEKVRDRPTSDRCIRVESRSLAESLAKTRAQGAVPIIAEIKRTSPTTDGVRHDDAVAIATEMVDAGATAISVLTEPTHFDGSTADLRAVRSAVDVPIVRKDFVLEATDLDRVAADAVLLIARFIDDLAALIDAANARGMEALVEVHTPDEIERALAADASIIGINNRDLGALEVDTDTFTRLGPTVPDDVTVIAESGVEHCDHVCQMLDHGADGILIGSAIMAGDVADTVDRFVSCADPRESAAIRPSAR